jgi:glycosyltransferase involved in cell wall biosynthesis
VSVNAVVSREDGDSLRRNCPEAVIRVVANGTDINYFTPNPGAIEPDTLIFAGSLNWYPNVSALRFFRDRIWPRLKAAVPDIQFTVAGHSPVAEIVAWAASDDAVELVDTPADIRPWIDRGAVFVCPIVDGGGTRLKLLDAMSSGKAIVTTSVGAEGLGVENGLQAIIADTEDAFTEGTLEILKDPALRNSLARCGREFVERNFAWSTIGMELESAYSRLRARP